MEAKNEPETYYLWDLRRKAPGKPGEVVRIRTRSRIEEYARYCAAAYRGQEPDTEWLDPNRSEAVRLDVAAVQWAGVVRVLAFGHEVEKAIVSRVRGRGIPVPTLDEDPSSDKEEIGSAIPGDSLDGEEGDPDRGFEV